MGGTDCPERYCVVFGDRSTYKSRANAEFRDYLKMRQHTRSLLVSSLPTSSLPLASLPSKSIILGADYLDSIIDDVIVPPAGTAAAAVTTAVASANDDNDTTEGDCNTKMNNGKQYFKFVSFDKEVGWYVYLNPYNYDNNSTTTIVTTSGISTGSNNHDKKKGKKKLINKDRIELRKKISQMIRDERKRTLKKHNTAIPQQQQQQQSQSQQQSSVLGQSSDIPLEVSSNSNISNNINGHRCRNSNELVGDTTSDFFGLIGGDSTTTMGIDIDKSNNNKRRKKNNSWIFNCDNSTDSGGSSTHSGRGVFDATNNNNNNFLGRN